MIDKIISYMGRLVLWLCVGLFFIHWITPIMYTKSCDLINLVDKTIFERYATGDKFEECIFLKGEEVDKTDIFNQLTAEIDELKAVKNVQEIGKAIFENKDTVEKIVSNNYKYQKYLISRGCSVDDFISWSEKISEIDDKIYLACLYVSFLILSSMLVVLLKLRKTFYLVAGIIYTMAIVSLFSDGIAGYVYINVFNYIGKISKEFLSYGDREISSLIFFQAFKESTLTFIIFDSIIQCFENNKIERNNKKIEDIKRANKYLYTSIDVQINYLKQMNNDDYLYIARMKIEPNIKYFDDEIKKLEIEIEKKPKKEASDKIPYIKKKIDYYMELKNELNWICSNKEEHTNAEYIEKLRKIQWLFYKCDFEY